MKRKRIICIESLSLFKLCSRSFRTCERTAFKYSIPNDSPCTFLSLMCTIFRVIVCVMEDTARYMQVI